MSLFHPPRETQLFGILRTLLQCQCKYNDSVWYTFKVILGGGRMYMTPKGTPDPEYPTSTSRKGDRKDKRNLIDVWLKAKPVGFV